MHLFLHLYQLIVPVNAARIYNLIRECDFQCRLTTVLNLLHQHTFCQQHSITVSGLYIEEPKKGMKKKDKLPYFFNHRFVLFFQRTTISSTFLPFTLTIADSIFPYGIVCAVFR